jgi:hypothetical protein
MDFSRRAMLAGDRYILRRFNTYQLHFTGLLPRERANEKISNNLILPLELLHETLGNISIFGQAESLV